MPSKSLDELEEMIGTTKKTAVDLTVEAGKVEEFASALSDDNPAHRDEQAANQQGFDHVPAPLTFLQTEWFPRYKPPKFSEGLLFDFGFEQSRLLHGEQEFEFERPILVGDTLTGTTELVDVYQREGDRGGQMTFAVEETRFRDDNGDLVATKRTTIIEREAQKEEGQV
jgi:acyl dehydratase